MAIPKTNRVIALLCGVLVLSTCLHANQASTPQAVSQVAAHRMPIRIAGVQEPLEMTISPIPVAALTEPEQMLKEATQSFDAMQSDVLHPALNQIIQKFPEFAPAYVMRLRLLCSGSDRREILSNVNSAISYSDNIDPKTMAELFSIRAKNQFDNGHAGVALDALEASIRLDPDSAFRFANSTTIAPDKTTSACKWNEADMNAVVQQLPGDYRAYLFRGLYYGSFASFSTDGRLLELAVSDFNQASQINPHSALPLFFKVKVINQASSPAQRDSINGELVATLNKALALDPDFLPAVAERDAMFAQSKQLPQEVGSVDKTIALNPSPVNLSDFDKATENKTRLLQSSLRYEDRAAAYMKIHEWDLAIRDITTAISYQVGGSVPFWDINDFRAIYPEYKTTSDEAIAKKLNQTFFPLVSYDYFSKQFMGNKTAAHIAPAAKIQELYLKRSDAYLMAGDWHNAYTEYQRAVRGFDGRSGTVERWREFNSDKNTHLFVDMHTFDDTQSTSIKFRIKEAGLNEAGQPNTITQYELNCDERKIRTLAVADEVQAGNALANREHETWQSITPRSRGDIFFWIFLSKNRSLPLVSSID